MPASSDSTIKLDPGAASALIAQGEAIGMQGAAAGATAAPTLAAGTPIDTAVGTFSGAVTAGKTAFSTARAEVTARRAAGGSEGVTALSQTEEQNAVRQGAIGVETAPAVATTLI